MRIAIIVCLLLAGLTIAVFGQVTGFDFVLYDDGAHVYNNPGALRGLTLESVAWAFRTTFVANYIPITGITFLLDHQIHGLDPAGYHLTNLLFHIANVVLLFIFLSTTTGRIWPSAFAAALFAIHPLHVESVAWISARKDVVSTFFWLAAMLAYVSYAKRPRILPYLLTFALFALGLLSKAMLVTFPFALLLIDLWPLERIDARSLGSRQSRPAIGRLVLEKIPFIAAVSAASVVALIVQARDGAVASTFAVPMAERIPNALAAYFVYLGKTIWPVDLIVQYPLREGALSVAATIAAAAILLAVTAALFQLARRWSYLLVGWLWYVGTLVPVIGLVQIGSQSMADRYTYLPLIGIFIAIAWAAADVARALPGWRRPLSACAALVVLVFAGIAWRQAGHWRDSVTLFSHAVAVDSHNVVGHSLLGKALYDRGSIGAARTHLERAVALRPSHTPALLNLGVLHVSKGRYDEAINFYARILQDKPDDHVAHTNMGNALLRLNRIDEAIEHLEAALREAPDTTNALILLGAARLVQERPRDAVVPLRRALEIDPEDAVAHLNLASALYQLDATSGARDHALEALRINPGYEDARAFLTALEGGGGAN
jgi:tetratricopeptide (TPR) repeat protein